MPNTKEFLRFASLAVALLAGSCAGPDSSGKAHFEDGAVNHPITVEPNYLSVKLPFSVPEAGLMPDDAARFSAFVRDYLERGNGAISISAPAGPDAQATIHYFGNRLAALGVPSARILVGTHDVVDGDTRVELGYISYAARVDKCGDWSEDLDNTLSNDTAPNFGCSVQHNIAAMVADPRDLVSPRSDDGADMVRRDTVVTTYEKGQPTAATKTQDQSGAVSSVNK